jgi:Mg2+ and Co2+ transporter CorA
VDRLCFVGCRYEQALAVKDQMIWSLMQEGQRLDALNKAEEELRRDYTGEIVEWIELSNRMSEEIMRLKKEMGSLLGLRAANERLVRENQALVDILGKTGKGEA